MITGTSPTNRHLRCRCRKSKRRSKGLRSTWRAKGMVTPQLGKEVKATLRNLRPPCETIRSKEFSCLRFTENATPKKKPYQCLRCWSYFHGLPVECLLLVDPLSLGQAKHLLLSNRASTSSVAWLITSCLEEPITTRHRCISH